MEGKFFEADGHSEDWSRDAYRPPNSLLPCARGPTLIGKFGILPLNVTLGGCEEYGQKLNQSILG